MEARVRIRNRRRDDGRSRLVALTRAELLYDPPSQAADDVGQLGIVYGMEALIVRGHRRLRACPGQAGPPHGQQLTLLLGNTAFLVFICRGQSPQWTNIFESRLRSWDAFQA